MEIDEDLKAFLVESNDNLNQIEGDLVALEQNPTDEELINRIYRNLHTLKGNCGFLALEKLESVAHAGENLLTRLRDRQLSLNPEITSSLLQVVDSVKQILTSLESIGEEGDRDYKALVEKLHGLEESRNLQEETSEETPEEEENLTIYQSSSIVDKTVRVDVDVLDKLMNLVGELVLCRNQILEFTNQKNDTALADTSSRLDLVTTELQEGVMKTRMQPIRTIWNKFPRLVRDLAINLGKQVQLEMEGEDTELDKTLIEAIGDPLTHIVRNCVDHGIESTPTRLAAGKPASGKILLRAFHESGYVIVEIGDDGGGIDPEKLKLKAIEKGLITSDRAARLNVREALNLIFLPGFSTAKRITNLSGRGVGMDVVRTNLEKIGGTIDIYSNLGRGTSFKLKIPLTLAIIPTLIVTTGGDRYAIPQVNLLELVRLEGEQARKGVEMVHGAPVHRLRGKLLPLVYLNKELKLDTSECNSSADNHETLNIVVLQATNKSFGLVVDSINDTQEIVVKPLGKQLKHISCFAGATIVGDGKVALILDVQGLAQSAELLSDKQSSSIIAENTEQEQYGDETQMLLLFEGADNRRMAIPLSQVARLEEFPQEAVERIGQQKVLQYREEILPLIYLSSILDNNVDRDFSVPSVDGKIQVVVVSLGKNLSGLLVENIVDIVEERISVKGAATQEEIKYAAVIQGKVTELLDVEAVIKKALPYVFQQDRSVALSRV
ncbi:MAG: chemotaxis protein CheW [Prochloraceae cyanobacterium]|nr:chemotaxis protein CheW [Prochloraceae cyanobacterium]